MTTNIKSETYVRDREAVIRLTETLSVFRVSIEKMIRMGMKRKWRCMLLIT